jgi:hypothetical protein
MKRSVEELRSIIEKEMPGFELVQGPAVDEAPSKVDADEGTPDLLPDQADERIAGEDDDQPEDQLVKVVPKDLVETPEAVRHTKTVLISGDGSVQARQG